MLYLLLAVFSSAVAIHFPQFYVIGAPKCATTSLHDLLISNTEFCHSPVKEAHYFDSAVRYGEGNTYWPRAVSTKCHGPYLDSTPDYFASFDVPLRMHRDFSPTLVQSARFAVILRDPTVRSFSWYNHMMNHCVAHLRSVAADLAKRNVTIPAEGWDTAKFCGERHCKGLQCIEKAKFLRKDNVVASLATFAEYVNSTHFPLQVGFYAQWLKHWLQYFERRQLLILNFEHLLNDTPAIVHSITRFFGLNLPLQPNITLPHDNGALMHTVLDCATREKLHAVYAPHVQELYDFLRVTAPDRSPYERDFGVFTEGHACT
jgi:hypothetical protein